MEPKEIEGNFVRMETSRVNLIQASLCVNCWPMQAPAFFVWGGMGLCVKCFEPHRKEVDIHGPSYGIDKRNYRATWGSDPVQDAEVI